MCKAPGIFYGPHKSLPCLELTQDVPVLSTQLVPGTALGPFTCISTISFKQQASV